MREVGEKAAMGRLFLMHLDGNVYSCKHCRTQLGVASDIISKVPLHPSASPLPDKKNREENGKFLVVPTADVRVRCG